LLFMVAVVESSMMQLLLVYMYCLQVILMSVSDGKHASYNSSFELFCGTFTTMQMKGERQMKAKHGFISRNPTSTSIELILLVCPPPPPPHPPIPHAPQPN